MKLPKGFLASGVRSGIRKKRPDVALIVAPDGASVAGVFTKNAFRAAPVEISRAALRRSGGKMRAVIVNAGCANAVTGREGHDAAKRVQKRVAEITGCGPSEVLLCSTGVIGTVLPDAKIRAVLPDAWNRLSTGGIEAASHAILTTDVGPKVTQASFRWNGGRARVVGFAKGAGMIHPNMATMLGFIMTDITAESTVLQKVLREVVDVTFNTISVDGDTSTNDTVLLMASGKAGGAPLESSDNAEEFRAALLTVCRELAWMIVRDGEGAIRVMDVSVRGARTGRDAKLAAHAVATSPLVKTALHGGDPNWGRILAAIGRSGARFSPRNVSLRIGSVTLIEDGQPATYREADVAKKMARERVPIEIVLGSGRGEATALSSDLGHDYVALNADYRS